MDINSCFPSAYLKAEDLRGKEVRVEIERCEIESLGDEDKPCLHFRGKSRAMVLNRTNAGVLTAALGPDTDAWIGATITLYPTTCSFGGRMVPALRIRVPQPAAAADEAEPPF